MSNSFRKRLLILGDGLSSRLFLLRLLNKLFSFDQKVRPSIIIRHRSDEKRFKPSTFSSTSHVGVMGISKGVGPLGDLLLLGLVEVEKFISDYILSQNQNLGEWGIVRGSSLLIEPASSQVSSLKLKNRFGFNAINSHDTLFGNKLPQSLLMSPVDENHLFFSAPHFHMKLNQECSRLIDLMSLDYNFEQSVLKSLNRSNKTLNAAFQNGFEETYDSAFLGLGPQGILENSFENISSQIPSGRQRVGSVWTMKLREPEFKRIFPDRSHRSGLLLSSSKGTFIYRPALNAYDPGEIVGEILLGATSRPRHELESHGEAYLHSVAWEELYSMHNFYKELLGLSRDDFFSFSKGDVLSGVRHYLPKRFPFAGDLSLGLKGNLFKTPLDRLDSKAKIGEAPIYSLRGLYKNGFNLAFLGTKLILDDWWRFGGVRRI